MDLRYKRVSKETLMDLKPLTASLREVLGEAKSSVYWTADEGKDDMLLSHLKRAVSAAEDIWNEVPSGSDADAELKKLAKTGEEATHLLRKAVKLAEKGLKLLRPAEEKWEDIQDEWKQQDREAEAASYGDDGDDDAEEPTPRGVSRGGSRKRDYYTPW